MVGISVGELSGADSELAQEEFTALDSRLEGVVSDV
jgi:hypothetical protein